MATVIRRGTASNAWCRTGRGITGFPDEGRMEIITGNGRTPGERPPPSGRGRLCGCAVRMDGPGSLDALISLNVCLKVAQS
jgi:hypothetical protein